MTFKRLQACGFSLVSVLGLSTSEVGAQSSWHVAGTPQIVAQPISFTNAGATLRGTLYRPHINGRVPAVVALHGASNGNASDPLYDHLRQGLPAMGIAVLIFDRRGSGRSTGSLKNVDYQILADDGIAGSRAIARLPSIDSKRIGYWGLSQGGWLAVLAAQRDPYADFVVSVSAPLVTPEQQMEFAMSNRLTVQGYSEQDVRMMLAARTAWTQYLRGAGSRAAAVSALSAIASKPWFDLMYLPTPASLPTNPATSSWRKEMDDDMFSVMKDVRIPVLCIYGGADPWIPVATTVARLRSLEATDHNIEDAIIANASHEMSFLAHEMMDVSSNQEPQAPAYFMLLASWLERVLRRT